jgi:hypothetical protein
MALVEQVMTREPYASATRVFWIVDNGSSHRGQAAIDRLAKRFPDAVMVHTPRHASWLNQIEIYFSVVQRKAGAPTTSPTLTSSGSDWPTSSSATTPPPGPWGGRSPQLTSTTCSTGSTSTSSRPPHRPPRRPHDQPPTNLRPRPLSAASAWALGPRPIRACQLRPEPLTTMQKKQRRSRGSSLPLPNRAIRASGSTMTSRLRERSMTSPPSTTQWPAGSVALGEDVAGEPAPNLVRILVGHASAGRMFSLSRKRSSGSY